MNTKLFEFDTESVIQICGDEVVVHAGSYTLQHVEDPDGFEHAQIRATVDGELIWEAFGNLGIK